MHYTLSNLIQINKKIKDKINELSISEYNPKVIAVSKTFTEEDIMPLIELRNFCKKHQKKLYIRNDVKLANKINADGLYISSSNKNLIIASSSFRQTKTPSYN